MGTRGPVPKRSDKIHGHRTAERARNTTKVDGAAAIQPELGMVDPHPVVASMYAALGNGPEAQFYTPAMWERARAMCHLLDGVLTSARPSSQMYGMIQSDWKALLVDAGELRRLGIEVQAAEPSAPLGDNVIDWAARARGSAGA